MAVPYTPHPTVISGGNMTDEPEVDEAEITRKCFRSEELTEAEKKALYNRLGDPKKIKRGRKVGYRAPGTVIREMMEGEFANVTERNIGQIVDKLKNMATWEDNDDSLGVNEKRLRYDDRKFAIKTLMDASNKIIDRQMEEDGQKGAGEIQVTVNRSNVKITSRNPASVLVNDDLACVTVMKQVKELPPAPDDIRDALGDVADDVYYNSFEGDEGEDFEVAYVKLDE